MAGLFAAAFTVALARGVMLPALLPLFYSAPEAMGLFHDLLASCPLGSAGWWNLLGLTEAQARYIVGQFEPVPFSATSRPAGDLGPRFNWTAAAVDVGAGGLGDTLHLLARRLRVLAVDARPLAPAWAQRSWRALLASGRVEPLQRAVSDRGGALERFFVDEYGQGLMSSLDEKIVPGYGRHALRALSVETITCDELLRRPLGHGLRVLYMKVDIEHGDAACLESLARAVRPARRQRDVPHTLPALAPTFFSVELPGDANLTARLLKALGEEGLGYRRFKVCRQRLFNLRLAKGDRYAASGPFGPEAVDFLRGAAWRSAGELGASLLARMQWEREAFAEWFDLHATF